MSPLTVRGLIFRYGSFLARVPRHARHDSFIVRRGLYNLMFSKRVCARIGSRPYKLDQQAELLRVCAHIGSRPRRQRLPLYVTNSRFSIVNIAQFFMRVFVTTTKSCFLHFKPQDKAHILVCAYLTIIINQVCILLDLIKLAQNFSIIYE